MRCFEDLEDLATVGSEDSILLSPECHEGAATKARYFPKAGTLSIVCSVCGMGVVDLVIAKRRSWAQRSRRAEGELETPKAIQKMDPQSRRNRLRKR